VNLELLREFEVFTHHPLEISDIEYLYQPYSQICSEKPEEIIKTFLEKSKLIMVKDERGTGKSSLVNYVLSQLDERFFPILYRLDLSGNFERVCSDPNEFARYILNRTLRSVSECMKISRREREHYRRYLAREISFKEGKRDSLLGRIKGKFTWVPGFVSTEAEIGSELQTYTEEALKEEFYNVDRIACIRDLCNVLETRKKRPIFVFDDTDHFLQQGSIDRTGLIDRFFIDIVPMFREFGCAIILNAHISYDSYETFQQAQKNIFDEVIEIPIVPFEGFIKMLNKKIQAVIEEAEAWEIFDEDALKLVYDHPYRRKSEERMRGTMRAIQDALFEAVKAGSERVTSTLMARALLEGRY